MIRWICKVAPILALVQLFTTAAIFTNTVNALAAEPPFVICDKQRYALCAAADCFVYNGLAYCKCDVLHGDSISLQLSYTTPAGETQNMSTFSLPAGVEKGGDSAVYTCPGTANAGSGVAAPVAYGQCDGGFCLESSRGKRFPGFAAKLKVSEIMCSCPISTDATAGSSDSLGYQIFGAYHPSAPVGSRCDANACAACSVPTPTANGAMFQVGAPTGSPAFLAQQLNRSVPPLNQCLCSCTTTSNGTTCTVGEDETP
jgi:hypothetical protein